MNNKTILNGHGQPVMTEERKKQEGAALVRAVSEAIAYCMDEISKLLPPQYALTFVARHTTAPENMNADIIMSNDEPTSVVKAVQRVIDDEKEKKVLV